MKKQIFIVLHSDLAAELDLILVVLMLIFFCNASGNNTTIKDAKYDGSPQNSCELTNYKYDGILCLVKDVIFYSSDESNYIVMSDTEAILIGTQLISQQLVVSLMSFYPNNFNIPVERLNHDTTWNNFYIVIIQQNTILLTILEIIRKIDVAGKIFVIMNDKESYVIISEVMRCGYYEVYFAVEAETGNSCKYEFSIMEISAYCSDVGTSSLKMINQWSKTSGFKEDLKFEKSFKGNFNNALLRISTNLDDIAILKAGEDYVGVEYYLLLYAMEKLNFTGKFVHPQDGYWGSYINGRWNGQVGQVVRNDSDFAVGALSITSERYNVVDPTSLIATESMVITSRKPDISARWQSIYDALGIPLWSRVGISTLIVGFVTYFSYKLDSTRPDMTLYDSLFISMKFLSPRRLKSPPVKVRFVLAICSLSWIVIAAYYRAYLQAIIFKPGYTEDPINSLADLKKRDKIFVMHRGTYWGEYLETSYDITNIDYIESHVGKVIATVSKNKHYVTVVDRNAIKHISIRALGTVNPLHYSSEVLIHSINTWLVRKTCPYRKYLSMVQMKAHQYGLMKHYEKKMILYFRKCIMKEYGSIVKAYEPHPGNILITMDYTHAVKYIFMFSYFSGILAFLGECIISFLLQKLVFEIITTIAIQLELNMSPNKIRKSKTGVSDKRSCKSKVINAESLPSFFHPFANCIP